MLGMFFHVFVCIFQRIICLVFFSEVVQKQTLSEIKKKLNGHVMASCIKNIHTENYENLMIFV